MEKKEEIRIYSNYIIGIIALVLSVFAPVSGLVLGIIGLVRIGKDNNSISKKARTLNLVAVVIGLIILVISMVIAIKGLNLGNFVA